jgi:hypothetical protein
MNVSEARTAPVQSTQKPTQLQKTEQSNQQAKAQEPQAKPPEQAQRAPVINTQGQTTGRVLNVTA